MPKGIFVIATAWLLANIFAFYFFGKTGAVISTYACMGIVWFGRRKLQKWLHI